MRMTTMGLAVGTFVLVTALMMVMTAIAARRKERDERRFTEMVSKLEGAMTDSARRRMAARSPTRGG
jgi:hypothetical protein